MLNRGIAGLSLLIGVAFTLLMYTRGEFTSWDIGGKIVIGGVCLVLIVGSVAFLAIDAGRARRSRLNWRV
jgi:hypothetical protein